MKTLLLINSVIIILTIIIKLFFRSDKNLDYKKINRFNINLSKRENKITNNKHDANMRFGLLTEILLFTIFTFIWLIWREYSYKVNLNPVFRTWYVMMGFYSLIIYFFACLSERNYDNLKKNTLKTIVLVPIYNENQESLDECIQSIFRQSRKVDEIHMMDDGSMENYDKLKSKLIKGAKEKNIFMTWNRQVNQGKRHAQANAYKNTRIKEENSIIVTVDSDGILSPHAIEEGLKPFNDPKVMSVAGMVVSKNALANTLSRLTDLLFTMQQLVERESLSSLGSVSVNSGALAFYRAEIMSKAIDADYLNETFGKTEVRFSDDSFLTLIALINGKAVSQNTAVVFADMPSNFNHHIRQQLRWMRGSFIRGVWRIRYTPLLSITTIRQSVGWMSFASSLYILFVLISEVFTNHNYVLFIHVLLPIVIYAYSINLKYFKVRRNDMSFKQQFFIYLISPFASLWNLIIIKSVKIFALFTLDQNAWGTRAVTEKLIKE